LLAFLHIHCELRSILLLVKTAKKRGGPCASFFCYNAWNTPTATLKVKGQTKTELSF